MAPGPEDEVVWASPREARLGDLVFVEGDGSDLTRLITRLDGSPFSHVGVVVGPRTMASSRTNRSAGLDDPDLGGVRLNDFGELAHRGLHLGRVRFDSGDRAGAVALVRGFVDADGESRSRFSFVKLFLVSAALNAIREEDPFTEPQRREMLGEAIVAARAWEWRAQREPSFFCSELVAAVYGLGFTVGDLTPGSAPATVAVEPVGPVARAGDDGGDRPRVLDLVRDLADLGGRFRDGMPTIAQMTSLARLFESIVRYDQGFLGDAVDAALALWKPRKVEAGALDADAVQAPTAPLPTALVTPRMLLGDRVVEWVRPLAL